MLVLKRALSILLSSLLAMPTVVWAKAPKRVPASKSVAGKNPVAKEKSEVIVPTSLPIVFKDGKAYSVSETPGRSGRVKTRSVTGAHYGELIMDKNDDGYADIVQVTRKDVTTTASLPFRGQFRRIDVERRMTRGVYKTKLLLSYDGKRYEMIEKGFHPYGRFGAEAARGDVCLVTNTKMFANFKEDGTMEPQELADRRAKLCETPGVISSLAELDRALEAAVRRSGLSREEVLHCQLDKFQRALFDNSCYSGRNARVWEESIHHMNTGLSRVMASHYNDRNAPSAGRNYLQCLDDNGWSASSTGVRQHIFDRFRDMSAALMNAGLSAQDIANNFAEVSPSACRRQDTIRGANGVVVNLQTLNQTLNRTSKPAIACGVPNSAHRAEFTNGTIVMFSTKDSIQRDTPNCNGCSADEAYASTIFHELVHASGFNQTQEQTVLAAENCCSGLGTADSRSGSCNTLRSTALTALRRDRVETLMNSLNPNYNRIAASVTSQFAPNGGQMMDTYNAYIGETIEQSLTPQVRRELSNCSASDSACREEVISRSGAVELIEQATRDFFTGPQATCAAYQRLGSGSGNCSTTQQQFLGMIRTQGGASTASNTQSTVRLVSGVQQLLDGSEYRRISRGQAVEDPIIPVSVISAENIVPIRPIVLDLPLIEIQPLRVSTLARAEAPTSGPQDVASVRSPGGREFSDTTGGVPDLNQATTRVQTPSTAEEESGLEPYTPPPRSPITVTNLPPPEPNPANAPVASSRTVVAPSNIAVAPANTGSPTRVTSARMYGSVGGNSPPTSAPTTYTSGVPMPSVSDGVSELQAGGGARTDIGSGNRLPISSLANDVGTAVTSAVNRVGQTVVRATTPVAEAAQQRMPAASRDEPSRQTSQQSSQSQAAALLNQQQQTAANALQSASPTVALRNQSLIGSFPTTPVSANISRPIALTGTNVSGSSGRDRSGGVEGGGRARGRGEPSERRVAGAPASGPTGSGGGSSPSSPLSSGSDRGEDNQDREEQSSEPPAEARGVAKPGTAEERDVASVEVAVPSRALPRARFQGVKGTTDFMRYIRRQISEPDMKSLLVNRDFVLKLRAEGVAVRSPNGSRVGAPPPAPLMELCKTQQRYMLEGTCR